MHFADQSWAEEIFAVRSQRTRDCQVLAFGAGEGAAPDASSHGSGDQVQGRVLAQPGPTGPSSPPD